MGRIFSLYMALLVAGFVVVGVRWPAVAEEATSEPYASVAGFELMLPAGWVTVDIPVGMMFVASGQEALEGAGTVPDGVRMILVNVSREEAGDRPLGDLLEAFITSQKLPGEVVTGPDQATIGGRQAVRLEGSGEVGGDAFVYLAAALVTEARVGYVIAMLPQSREGELRASVEDVIATVVLGEPSPVPSDDVN